MKRLRFEVLVKLLRFTEAEKRKTQIVYHCNLSHTTVTNAIDLLLKKELLEKRLEYYRTTEKGLEFIKQYETIENVFNAKANSCWTFN